MNLLTEQTSTSSPTPSCSSPTTATSITATTLRSLQEDIVSLRSEVNFIKTRMPTESTTRSSLEELQEDLRVSREEVENLKEVINIQNDSICDIQNQRDSLLTAIIGLFQQWVTWYSHPYHNIISRNENNRSKLVILQSFCVLCYIFRKWEHFQITKFNRVGKPCSPATFSIQILLIFLRFELPPNFIFQCYIPQTWQFYLVGRSRDPLLQKAY